VLTQLSSDLSRNLQFVIHNHSRNLLPLTALQNSGLCFIDSETIFLKDLSDKADHLVRAKLARHRNVIGIPSETQATPDAETPDPGIGTSTHEVR